jgi:ABC-type dipeptide/oligopeptide/nickel transport system permease subunit
MLVIGIVSLVALLGGLLRPDPTPWANRQVLEIKDQPPGFRVTFVRLPGDGEEVPVFRMEQWGDSIRFERFNGFNELIPGAVELLHVPGGADLMTRRYLMGTDPFGRDVLSRLMAGTVISLSVGLIAVLISLVIGIPLGALAGYFRAEAPSFTLFGRRFRWPVDDVIMWLVNVIWSIPTLLLVIAITLALGKGFVQVFIAVGLTMWVEVARIVRGEVIRTREMEYVEAAKALGYTHGRIIFRHILPNVMGPVIVISAANFATAILMEAGLSFLGIGAQLPMVSWGGMIRSYYPYITTDLWHLALLPGVCIMLLTLAFMLVGNGLRDALDTRSISAR